MTTNLNTQALNGVYAFQRLKDKVILHTDLELQYTSQDFKDLTLDFNKIHSFSNKQCF